MAGTGKITRKREHAISALLGAPTVQEAAQVAQVGERTLWRWLQEPEFQRAYMQARRQVVSQAVARLQQATGEAVEGLQEVLKNDDASSSAKVSAARTILELSFKALELEDLEARITELEEVLKDEGKHEKKSK